MLASIDSLKNPSLGDLALAEQIQPPSVTRLVRNMEKSRLITCAPDADDRRSTRVNLTALGRKEIEGIRRRKTEFLERKLMSLSSIDQRKADELVLFLEMLLAGE
jgi:DNA-binding MarR family transcriptional regulator